MNVALLFVFFWMATPPQQTKESLYYQSMQFLQQKQYEEAKTSLYALRKMLEKEQAGTPKGTKTWHLLTLGQSDALSHLAHIAWLQQQKQTACLMHQEIEKARKTLPANWTSWSINSTLRKRLLASQTFLNAQCAAVPSFLVLKVKPPHAKAFLQQEQPGKAPSWKEVKLPNIEVFQARVTVKIEAPQFHTKTLENIAVTRWKTTLVPVVLVEKPAPKIIVVVPPRPRIRPRIIPRRPVPPPPVPIYRQWWFWTLIGAGVVGGATAIIVGVAVSSDANHIFRGNGTDPYYKIW